MTQLERSAISDITNRSLSEQSEDSIISVPASDASAVRRPLSVHQRFQSRLIGDVVEKPWLERKESGKRALDYARFFPWLGFAIGVCAMAALIYDGYRTINTHKYCLVFEDNFQASVLDASKWSHSVELGGFGNGQFEWATDSSDNTFIKDKTLFLKPTLTNAVLSEDQIRNGYTVDLLKDGSCTSTDPYQCVASSNATTGKIINPVRSSRIHTKGKASIRYGRVEIQAKMPKGDWLWPALWMLPTNDTYGTWPRSGEIDIAESRGNGYDYPAGGQNQMASGLHWGPESDMDGYYKTLGAHKLQRGDLTSDFHTFGLEWTPDYIFTYLDTKLIQVQYTRFNEYFWRRGAFPAQNVNNTAITDIWSQTGQFSTPFDQEFYLIMNVAVGGTNGWFPDTEASKPWVNAASSARKDFYDAEQKWHPSWDGDNSALQVKSVKMWQQCD